MRSKHPSDSAFEAWVMDGGGDHLLRTHVVQAGFREGWNAREQHDGEADIRRMREALELIVRGVWTARNSIETIRYTARRALEG